MKFVALISGGKDSTYNILECLNQGHELVALANLHPSQESGLDELDSYMYQSVGHEVIDNIAKCIGVPLFKAEITGAAINSELNYTPSDGDETEDLFNLLKKIKGEFTSLEGVSSGAILSNYQRSRVENVCERLGLISLAYLWKRPQLELLDSMIECGIKSIIIKICSGGLTEKHHLSCRIDEFRENFNKISKVFNVNPCGEGGEYETLTLDAPYFRKYIKVTNSHIVTLQEDIFCPVKYMHIDRCIVCDKSEDQYIDFPLNLDNSIMRNTKSLPISSLLINKEDLRQEIRYTFDSSLKCACKNFPVLKFQNVIVKINTEENIENCAKRLFVTVTKRIASYGIDLSSVVYVVLYMHDMTHFEKVNRVYMQYFPGLEPPPRTCIQLIENSTELAVDMLYDSTGYYNRETLRIQSRSHWVPATHEQESQAISCVNVSKSSIYWLLSGQMALQPHNHQMYNHEKDDDIVQEMLLCIRHVTRLASVAKPFPLSWMNLASLDCFYKFQNFKNDLAPQYLQMVFHEVVCEECGDCLCSKMKWVPVFAMKEPSASLQLQAMFHVCSGEETNETLNNFSFSSQNNIIPS